VASAVSLKCQSCSVFVSGAKGKTAAQLEDGVTQANAAARRRKKHFMIVTRG
jgi:hypothetical protein